MKILRISFLILILFAPHSVYAENLDAFLDKVILAFDLKPITERKSIKDYKYSLGQALFFDPILSGNRDVACATCHVFGLGSSDNLPMSIGIGGKGVGISRMEYERGVPIARNSLDLWGRGRPEFTTFFWDGRVQLAKDGKQILTPYYYKTPVGLESTLAAAVLFPVVESDEMTGRYDQRSSKNLPKEHANQPNKIAMAGRGLTWEQRGRAIYAAIVDQVLGSTHANLTQTNVQYRNLFKNAFPQKDIQEAHFVDFANAIAHFISNAFVMKKTPWDRYLEGNSKAITEKQKRGAILFYGKGKCTVCHSGTYFTDQEFHVIPVPQIGVGKAAGQIDYGRAGVTKKPEDRYRFRTPPLRNVERTSPYGHNGYFQSIKEVIRHHVNPIPALARAQNAEKERSWVQAQILFFASSLLRDSARLDEKELEDLVAFLTALSFDLQDISIVVPVNVPSGLNTFVPQNKSKN